MRAHQFPTIQREEALAVARRYSGPECVHVVDLLREVQSSVPAARGVSVTLELDESLYITADEIALRLVLATLLRDVIEHSRGGGQVFMRCRAENSGIAIEVEVEDECRGATNPEPSSEAAATKLLGAQRIIEAMGGELAFEHESGRGCTYHLLFALGRPTSRPPQATRDPAD